MEEPTAYGRGKHVTTIGRASLVLGSADFGSLLVGTWGLPSPYQWAPRLLQGHDVPATEAADLRAIDPEVVDDQLAVLPVELTTAFGQFGFPQSTGAEATGLVERAREAASLLAAGGATAP